MMPSRARLARLPLHWLVVLAALAATAPAQPSGGPYGPLRQTFEVPADAGRVFYVAPDADASSRGDDPEQPMSLEAAISQATTGDAIILRGGVYRTGNLVLNQGLTLQPFRDERPIIKGTRVADQWERQDNGLWRTSWETLFPSAPAEWWRRHREGAKTPLYRFNNDMVFVDGRLLSAVGWEGDLDENSYYIDYDAGHVYLATDPTDRLVEITAFDNALTRTIGEVHGRPSDRRGFIIRGLTFTQYAYRAIEIEGHNPEGLSPESDHGKDVVGTTLEHVTISYCSRVAGYFRGDRLTIRHCLISDTSTEGIFILSSNDVLLEKNILRRNNIEQITGYYPAAVKIFNQCYRVTCRDNLVIDHPYSNGIWWDVGNVDGMFVNNWVERTDNGFFFEISQGALVAGNVFVDCPTGIFVLNSAGVQVYQNTLVNSGARFQRTERSAVGDHFGWHPSTGPDVDERDGHGFVGNLLYADETRTTPLLSFEQPAALCERLTEPHVSELDHNVYVHLERDVALPLMIWSPADGEDCRVELGSLDELHALHDEFEQHGRYLKDTYGSLFESVELSRYELAQPLEGHEPVRLPDPVRQALGWPASAAAPGAYPAR